MPTLPAASAFTGSTVTEAQFKTAITDQREYLATLLGAAGTQQAALTALGAPLNGVSAKTAAYTVVGTDRGKLIDATSGSWTLNLTAAATVGAGFMCAVRNSGTGTITIDPNGSEQVDGAATITLAAGDSCILVCDGTGWRTVGRSVPEYGVLLGVYSRTTSMSSTAITPPAGTTRARICVQGGGGNGGAGYYGNQGSGGGGAYAEAVRAITGNVTVVVGGVASASSVAGAGTTITAAGGGNGTTSANGAGGATPTTGDINVAGIAGVKGKGGDTFGGGSGGEREGDPGFWGGGGASGGWEDSYGGPGGAGSAGYVIIYWYK